MARLSSANPEPLPDMKHQNLVGQLSSDGTASLQAHDTHESLSLLNPPRSLKEALTAPAAARRHSNTSTGSSMEEDYDALKHDPRTVVPGGKGGGYERELNGATPSAQNNSDEIKAATSRPGPSRLRSIPVTLNKLEENGRYILTADDEALREILKLGIEREKDPATAKKKRTKFSESLFSRQFTAFDRMNADTADSPFHGFFNLFWLGVAIYCVQLLAYNYQKHGNPLGTNEIVGLMFRRDVLILGLSDGILCGATGFGLLLQELIFRGSLSWNKEGWIIQSVWEVFYMALFLWWTRHRDWPWTHTVFFVLHGLVMLMKQHSWAFYNGHLSEEFKLRRVLEAKLKQLEAVTPMTTPSATTPQVSALSTSYLDYKPTAADLHERRQSKAGMTEDGTSNISQVAAAIESGEPLSLEQVLVFERILKWEIDALTEDLKGKCERTKNYYPTNLNIINHYEYIVLPTLVYELEYPRSERINWYYVLEKFAAVFGVLGIMNLVSQTFIYPVVVKTIIMKEAGMTIQERLTAFPWVLSDLVFPFMAEYMMTWYVIWECILNLLAELTYFADRGFYADWWNSTSWDQFARDWNRPVHNFLLRHVYHSSISSMRVNKYTATLITFFLSACVHELVMWCLFKKLRGYLLILQMCQLPLVQLSRTKWLKGRKTLGNLMFWVGICTGPSLLCSLYLII